MIVNAINLVEHQKYQKGENKSTLEKSSTKQLKNASNHLLSHSSHKIFDKVLTFIGQNK